MTPRRVAVVARAVMGLHGLGGLERHVRDLVVHLAKRGVAVTLITPPPRSDRQAADAAWASSPLVTARHVPYVTFPGAGRRGTTVIDRSTAYPVFGYRAGRLALSLVRAGGIDIVHGLGASVLGYALARRRPDRSGASAPLVFNPQGLEEFGASAPAQAPLKRIGYAPLRAAVRACAPGADRIIATDRALESVVIRHLHPRPGQLCTIPNAIDLDELDAWRRAAAGADMRRRQNIDPDELLILSVGRIEANKGFEQLAAALAMASSPEHALAGRRWRWVLVGAGPNRAAVERAVAQHGIGAHVVLAGRVTDADLHAWYDAASFFAHPTRYEGSSIVTLEAMGHRKAVVATRAGGLPDKVQPGVNGWLVPPDDVPALARAIEEAAGNDGRLVVMGVESRAIVEREFAWSVVIERQIALYETLLGNS
jgi:glycogen(starch) synthase